MKANQLPSKVEDTPFGKQGDPKNAARTGAGMVRKVALK